MCARLWRADACAQGVPVARTAGSPYVYGSNGDSQESREFKAPGAGQEHTSEVRGGGRDPGVRRPGSGLGRPTARSKFPCRNALQNVKWRACPPRGQIPILTPFCRFCAILTFCYTLVSYYYNLINKMCQDIKLIFNFSR